MAPALPLAIAGVLFAAAVPADAEPRLRETAAAWGLDVRHHHGGSGQRYMVETMGSGVAMLDYDGDGDEDLFFVDGGALPGYTGEPPRSRLLRNDGPGRFTDVTERSRIAVAAWGMGAVAGDVDADGDLDLYVTAFGPNQLFRNDGDGGFTDVTATAGVGDPQWSAGAAFADADRDGDLDLYVANYVDFTVDDHRFCGDRERGVRVYCNPAAYSGVPDRYYRNRGDGTFEDATAAAGLAGPALPGLGVVFADLDGDAWPDLFVANDSQANLLFRNRGDGTFEDVSLLSGTAYGDTGNPEAGMGVATGDVDGDGHLDLVVTNFEGETNALYRGAADMLFLDARWPTGIAGPSRGDLAFGVTFADLDHDADLDLVVANGHIWDNAAELGPGRRYGQRNVVMENRGGGRFEPIAASGLDAALPSRGLAAGDLDGDGDLDLVVTNCNERAEVYENVGASSGATGGWLLVDLVAGRGEPFAVGAALTVEAAGGRQVRVVHTGASYLSQEPLTQHVGLGAATAATVRVRWADGGAQRFAGLPASRRLRLYGLAADPPLAR